MGYLISETTKEEREAIVAESLGNIEATCDGCMSGLAEMYQDYIDGKKGVGEINMEFNGRFVEGGGGGGGGWLYIKKKPTPPVGWFFYF